MIRYLIETCLLQTLCQSSCEFRQVNKETDEIVFFESWKVLSYFRSWETLCATTRDYFIDKSNLFLIQPAQPP